MGDYKESKEWSALNHIWTSCSSTIRAELYEDFEIIMSFIKKHYVCDIFTDRDPQKMKLKTEPSDYLNELSQETKIFILDRVQEGEKNLYHSIMAIIGNNKGRFKTVDDLWNYYLEKYQNSRSYIFTHEKEVREIIGLCLQRMEERGENSCDGGKVKEWVEHNIIVKDLSIQAKELMEKLETDEKINLYQSIMGTIGAHKEIFKSSENLWNHYIKKHKNKHPSLLNYKREIIEIMEYCLACNRKTRKSKNRYN